MLWCGGLRLIGVAMERRLRVDWCSDGRGCGRKLSTIIEKTKLRVMVINQ